MLVGVGVGVGVDVGVAVGGITVAVAVDGTRVTVGVSVFVGVASRTGVAVGSGWDGLDGFLVAVGLRRVGWLCTEGDELGSALAGVAASTILDSSNATRLQ